jgi:hypothetical protein
VNIASGRPPSRTALAVGANLVRRMFHHWYHVPSSPIGCTPIFRISSATHPVARISSSVPASRPRMPSPAMA